MRSTREPELWDAVTGTRRDLPEYREEDGRTIVPLVLPPSGLYGPVTLRVEKR